MIMDCAGRSEDSVNFSTFPEAFLFKDILGSYQMQCKTCMGSRLLRLMRHRPD